MTVSGPQSEVSLTEAELPSPGNPTSVRASSFNPSELLSRVWQRSLPLIRDRVASLDRLAQAAVAAPLSPQERVEAADLAHKLAGSLGMFGFPEGTEIARDVEHHVETENPVNGTHLSGQIARLRSLLALP